MEEHYHPRPSNNRDMSHNYWQYHPHHHPPARGGPQAHHPYSMQHHTSHYPPQPSSRVQIPPPPPPPPSHQHHHMQSPFPNQDTGHSSSDYQPSWKRQRLSKSPEEDGQKHILRQRQQQLYRQNMLRPRADYYSSESNNEDYYRESKPPRDVFEDAFPPSNYPSPDYFENRKKLDSPKTSSSFEENSSLYSPVPYEQIENTEPIYYPENNTEEDVNVISPGRTSQKITLDFRRSFSPVRAVPVDSFDSDAFLPPRETFRPLAQKKQITPDKAKLTPTSSPLPVLPSREPVALDMSQVNDNDVLCGRGGGTNSQIGNRRFRKLVQDHQPQYLTARRKEKPMIARKIVRIIRQRGGRFLKRDDNTEHLFEVGDERAEAKTSQALREGLDVRATKGAVLKKKDTVPVSRSCSFATPERVKAAASSPTVKEILVDDLNDDEKKLFLEFSPPRVSNNGKAEHKTITPCRSYDSKSSLEASSNSLEEESTA